VKFKRPVSFFNWFYRTFKQFILLKYVFFLKIVYQFKYLRYSIHARSGLSHFLNNVFDLTTFVSSCAHVEGWRDVKAYCSSHTETISQFLFLHPNPPQLFFFYFSPTHSCFIFFISFAYLLFLFHLVIL